MRTAVLLCISLAAPALAWAEDAAPFVTQLRLPARQAAIDVMAWRTSDGIEVTRADLMRLQIVLPEGAGERIALSAVPGLAYTESAGDAAVILTCSACLTPQRIDDAQVRRAVDQARGAYINYDLDAQWLEREDPELSSVAEAAVFGRWGLFETSWVAATAGAAEGVTRLETRWTRDFPDQRLRLRVGDATTLSAGNAPLRFAGMQIGRHFGLEPSFITYPTALISGEAASASTVELYVDGALRAREQVEAGPFVFDNAPLVSGGGEAQLVITDVAGRQQIVSRPFFVSTSLLRPGLSDWAVSIGAEREDFGFDSNSYGETFLAARYRLGLTPTLTAEAALDWSDSTPTAQAGFSFASVELGQIRVSHARTEEAGASEFAWFQDLNAWSWGLQADVRDEGFQTLGLGESNLRRSYASTVSVDLDALGAASLTAASVEFFDLEDARTFTLSYEPRFVEGSLAARIIYTERRESEVAFALTYTASLNDDISAGAGYDENSRGASYRASLQRAPNYDGGLGWRVRASEGRRSYAEAALSLRGRFGDSSAQIARAGGIVGIRFGHVGSFGVIESHIFAAAPIRGGFALVDAGAPDIGVLRDRFQSADTGAGGRVIITGLRPYDANIIAIRADDFPFDRTPAQTESIATPAEGAGVVVRFDHQTERLIETNVLLSDETTPPRGAVLVRSRDGARFPVGANGRVVLRGAQVGDVLQLDGDARCTARADEAAAEHGLLLECSVA